MSARGAVAQQQGVDDEMLAKVDDYEHSDLSAEQRAALRLADAYLIAPAAMTDEMRADVAAHAPLGDPITQGGKSALRPDGHELAVATPAGTVLWDLDPEHWLKAACQVAGRNMTPQEWTTYIGDLAPYRQTCPALA